jgi:squalene-hopene/tetraprenyl-beta-curcumene cyclase
MLVAGILVTCLGANLFAASPNPDAGSTSWSPSAAASYLDQRASWWMAWPPAARDHGTFCISCHTAIPYALSRPSLRSALGEQAPSETERRLLDNVTKRVRLWKESKPYYENQARQSRGTEAVLNALILASSGARGTLSDDARAAFDNMWALQENTGPQKGAWPWINFRNEPWEADDSPFFGASLAAVASGTAPQSYRSELQIRTNLQLLREYLSREYSKQALIQQAVLLWASTKLPDLLSAEQQRSIIGEVLKKQRDDGGWSLSSVAWTWRETSLYSLAKLWVRSDASPLEAKSDGYATGLIALALQQAGLSRQDPQLQRALAWLARNQSKPDGGWSAYSLNRRHGGTSGTGLFMSDAATAFAVLALTQSHDR